MAEAEAGAGVGAGAGISSPFAHGGEENWEWREATVVRAAGRSRRWFLGPKALVRSPTQAAPDKGPLLGGGTSPRAGQRRSRSRSAAEGHPGSTLQRCYGRAGEVEDAGCWVLGAGCWALGQGSEGSATAAATAELASYLSVIAYRHVRVRVPAVAEKRNPRPGRSGWVCAEVVAAQQLVPWKGRSGIGDSAGWARRPPMTAIAWAAHACVPSTATTQLPAPSA